MSKQFSPEELQSYREEFKKFDTNGDGKIESKEFSAYFKKIGSPLSDETISKMMNEADSNHDGSIDFEEFIIMVKKGWPSK